MPRTYEQQENERLVEKIAIEIGLLNECEFHEEIILDSGVAFEDIEADMLIKLDSYEISDDLRIEMIERLKNIQDEYRTDCIQCNERGL